MAFGAFICRTLFNCALSLGRAECSSSLSDVAMPLFPRVWPMGSRALRGGRFAAIWQRTGVAAQVDGLGQVRRGLDPSPGAEGQLPVVPNAFFVRSDHFKTASLRSAYVWWRPIRHHSGNNLRPFLLCPACGLGIKKPPGFSPWGSCLPGAWVRLITLAWIRTPPDRAAPSLRRVWAGRRFSSHGFPHPCPRRESYGSPCTASI